MNEEGNGKMKFHFDTWLIYFYFYCICGWMFESAWVSLRTRKWTNRGFMKGPWLPLYGSGAVLVLIVTLPFRAHPAEVYFVGLVAATILEYITGVAMLKIFKVRYWDYRYQKLQFQGHICLTSSIAWGFLSILMVYVVHPPVERFLARWNTEVLSVVTFVITIGMVYDFANALREAIDLRALIIQAEDIKKRLDVAMEEEKQRLGELVEEKKEQHAQNAELRRERIDQAISETKEQLSEKKEQLSEKKEQILEAAVVAREQLAGVAAEKKEQLTQAAMQYAENSAEKKQQREEEAEQRRAEREQQAEEIRERWQQTITELRKAQEDNRLAMARHSVQLLIHNPGSSFDNMEEESKEVRRRLLLKRRNRDGRQTK